MFYKALAKQIGIDLDRFNISVLMADGIGFKPYVSLLRSLNIPFVLRTDNDVFRVAHQNVYRFAGVQRAVEIYKTFCEKDPIIESLVTDDHRLQGFATVPPPDEIAEYAGKLARALERAGIFISEVDLEHDLHSALPDVTANYFGIDREEDVIAEMQKRKATFMFDFLQQHSDALVRINRHPLASPLFLCQQIAEAQYGIDANP